jgi:opine dehydrogenase
MKNNLKWAIIGAGNGGQSAAGHLGLMGHTVRIFDINTKTVEELNRLGGIQVNGIIDGYGPIEMASTQIEEVIDGADIIMVIAPALAHRSIARTLSHYLKDGQIVFIHPGATGGALEFRAVFDEMKCSADVLIGEAMSLIYVCRAERVGKATIFGMKNMLMISALPANRTDELLDKVKGAYPNMYAGKHVLQTSLENLNTIVHPGPSLLNTSLIESEHEWNYYWDGITPTIGKFAEGIDSERLMIGKALGLELTDVKTWFRKEYNSTGETLTELVRSTKEYASIGGQKDIRTRFLLEDIPMGLVPMVELAKIFSLDPKRMKLVIELGEQLLETDFYESGRTLDRLGIDGLTKDQILEYVKTGKK